MPIHQSSEDPPVGIGDAAAKAAGTLRMLELVVPNPASRTRSRVDRVGMLPRRHIDRVADYDRLGLKAQRLRNAEPGHFLEGSNVLRVDLGEGREPCRI